MSSKLHDNPRHRRPGRGGAKFLAAGALGSAAVAGGAVAALAGHPGNAPVPARAAAIPARAAAIPAALTGDVLTHVPADPVVGPYVSYQPPASNGRAGIPYRLGPGSTIVSEDGQQAYTVQSDGSVQYSDTDGNVGSVSNGALQLPGGGLITFPGQQESDPGTGYPFAGLVQKASLTSGDQGQDLIPQQQIDQAFGAFPPSATQSQQESGSAASPMVSQTDPTQATTPGVGQQSANQQATSQQATSQRATSQQGLSQPGTSASGGAASAGQGTSTAAGNSSTIGNTSAGSNTTGFTSGGFTSGGFTSTPGSVTTSGTFSS
jgi:hypothetical protein